MTATPKMGRNALLVLPAVLVPVAFFAAMPWLKNLDRTTVLLITAATAIFEMAYANYLSYRAQRGLDEVQRAGGAFAHQWGAPAGHVIFVLLLLLPPVQEAVSALVTRFAADHGAGSDRMVVVLAMMLGFCAVVLLQAIGACVVQAIWWSAKR